MSHKQANSWLVAKTIHVSLPESLLDEINEAAKANYESRSDYIRESLVLRLKGQRIVEDDKTQDVVEIG